MSVRLATLVVCAAIAVGGCSGEAAGPTSLNIHKFPALEKLLPLTLGGVNGSIESITALDYVVEVGRTPLDGVVDMYAWFDGVLLGEPDKIEIAMVQMGEDLDPTAFVAVFRVPRGSVDGNIAGLRHALEVTAGRHPNVVATESAIAQKSVTSVLNTEHDPRPAVFYAKDDMFFGVYARTDAVVVEAFSKLP